jgi:hypothetical protein
METERHKPKGRSNQRAWYIIPSALTIVSLTCGGLYAFCANGERSSTAKSDEKNIYALLMPQDKERIRLVAQDGNALSITCQKEGQAGEYYVLVRFEKQVPIRGENRIAIKVLDGARKKVTGATVEIEYLMPSLPGRPSMMHYRTTARQENGAYRADVILSMNGEWIFKVHITKDDKIRTFQFPIEVLH